MCNEARAQMSVKSAYFQGLNESISMLGEVFRLEDKVLDEFKETIRYKQIQCDTLWGKIVDAEEAIAEWALTKFRPPLIDGYSASQSAFIQDMFPSIEEELVRE